MIGGSGPLDFGAKAITIFVLRVLAWFAIAFVAIYLFSDLITYELHVRPVMNADMVEFITSPRYPINGD